MEVFIVNHEKSGLGRIKDENFSKESRNIFQSSVSVLSLIRRPKKELFLRAYHEILALFWIFLFAIS